ncbi:hypothetical protein [Actinomyces naeslundii]|uniref:hypothetical protein n=1 Tax=Actinomyces naeslundii TaxID=1655 RepID=UPI0005BE458C|nr:hypothetical protein [Actinomyces naeslundii]
MDGARAAGVAGEGGQQAVLEELVQGGRGVQDVGRPGQSHSGADEVLGQAGHEVGELDGRRQEDDGGATRILGGTVLSDGDQDLTQGAGGAGVGHGDVEAHRVVVEALGRAVADEPDQVVVIGVTAIDLAIGAEVKAGADDDGVLTGQGEVDQVQEGGFDGADDGQGVPAVGCSRGAGKIGGEVIRGIGHEVLQQS